MPLTKVPDPYEKFESFGHHNNAMLCAFLDSYGFDSNFKAEPIRISRGGFTQS
jgi:lysyl-tRNA synthetase class 1